jgi:membrane protease YdiL (CAAX protease family)
MRYLRTIVATLHALMLLSATAFGVLVARPTLQLFCENVVGLKDHSTSSAGNLLAAALEWNVLAYIGVIVALLILTISYAFILVRKGPYLLAPVIYVSSCLPLCLSIWATLTSVGKSINPTDYPDLEYALIFGGAISLFFLIAATIGLVWTYRNSSWAGVAMPNHTFRPMQ